MIVPGPRMTIVDGGRRWTARATSVAGIETELSRIWGAAARESHEADLSAREHATALGDPHLAGRLDRPGDVRVRTRTSVLTLVVLAERPETAERALGAVNELSARHPSRVLILAPGDPDGPAWIDARISAHCRIAGQGGAETCTEQILVRTGGEIDQHLAELVQPLLIHDLPVVLWWPDDPPIGRGRFGGLIGACDRLVVDSGAFGDAGRARLAGLAALCAAGRPVIHDIGWMRLRLWRELLAGLFDHPLLGPELARVRSLRLDVLRPGETLRLTRAGLLAGWLAGALGWTVSEPLAPRRGSDVLVGALRAEGGDVHLEVRPVPPESAGRPRSSGSLLCVELESGGRGHDVRARVTRQRDHLLATADRSGVEVCRRAGRLEAFSEAPYLAQALEDAASDHVLTRSIESAVPLLGR